MGQKCRLVILVKARNDDADYVCQNQSSTMNIYQGSFIPLATLKRENPPECVMYIWLIECLTIYNIMSKGLYYLYYLFNLTLLPKYEWNWCILLFCYYLLAEMEQKKNMSFLSQETFNNKEYK